MLKLNQVLAVEKGVKQQATEVMSAAYLLLQKPPMFNGMNKTFQPLAEDGEKLPDERQVVQQHVAKLIASVQKTLIPLYDTTYQKDAANQTATADVILDNGLVLLTSVPVTTLLFLEKQLTDLRTFANKLPTLENSDNWTFDPALGCYKSDPVSTMRNVRIKEPMVISPATPQHPAQVAVIEKDVAQGRWTTTKFSAAVPTDWRSGVYARADELLRAVKRAREAANMVDAPVQQMGHKVLAYVFG